MRRGALSLRSYGMRNLHAVKQCSRGFVSLLRIVDPHRVAVREVEATIKVVQERMAKEEQECHAELSGQLERLRAEQLRHEDMASDHELRLVLAGVALSLIWWDDTWGRFELGAVSRILRHQVTAPKLDMYVVRASEEQRIARVIGVPSIEYNVVVGPRGSGKSSVVLHAAAGHGGVATFSVSSNRDNAYVRTAEAFGLNPKHYDLDDHHQLVRVLENASKWHARLEAWGLIRASAHPGNWVPTIIVEIDSRDGQDTIAAIAKQLKIVASDHKAARVILILSDVNAQFALPRDPARQEVIWIHDLSEAEARLVMEKYNFDATEEEKRLIFRRIGTRVSTLVRLIEDVQGKKVPSVEAAVNMRIADAKGTIRRLLEFEYSHADDDPNKIEFKRIFDELLKNPSGIPVASFSGATSIPEICSKHVKDDHAFSYYNPDHSYVLYSPAYFEAAKELRSERKF